MTKIVDANTWKELCNDFTPRVMNALRKELNIPMGCKLKYISESVYTESIDPPVYSQPVGRVDKQYVEYVLTREERFANYLGRYSDEHGWRTPANGRRIYLVDYPFVKDGERQKMRCHMSHASNTFYVYRPLDYWMDK